MLLISGTGRPRSRCCYRRKFSRIYTFHEQEIHLLLAFSSLETVGWLDVFLLMRLIMNTPLQRNQPELRSDRKITNVRTQLMYA